MSQEAALVKNEAAAAEAEEQGPVSEIRPKSPELQTIESGDKQQIEGLLNKQNDIFLSALDREWDNVPEPVKNDPIAAAEAKKSEEEARRQAEQARVLAEGQVAKALGADKPFDKFEYSKSIADDLLEKQEAKKSEDVAAALEALGPIANQESSSDNREQLVAVKVEQPRGFVGYEKPVTPDKFEVVVEAADETPAESLEPQIKHEFVGVEPQPVASAVEERPLPAFEVTSPEMLRKSLEDKKRTLDEMKQKPEPEQTEVNKETMAVLAQEIAIAEKKLEKVAAADELAKHEAENDELEGKIEAILQRADQKSEGVIKAREALGLTRRPEAIKKAEAELRLALIDSLSEQDKREIRRIQGEQSLLGAEIGASREGLLKIGAALVGLESLLAQSRNRLEQRKQEQAEKEAEGQEAAERAKAAEEAEGINRQNAELRGIVENAEEARAARNAVKAEARREFVRTAYRAGGKGLKGVLIGGAATLALGLFSVSKILGAAEKFAGWLDKRLDYMFNRDFADKARDLWRFLTFADDKPEAPQKKPPPAE